MTALVLLLQVATPAQPPLTSASATPPSRFSILADPCARVQRDGRDVVVCGQDRTTTQRLPYPQEIVPDHGVPSNPLVNGRGALAAEAAPCASLQGGCPSGVFPPIIPAAVAIVHAIQNGNAHRREARARAADGDRRQPIDLDAPGAAGRLEP